MSATAPTTTKSDATATSGTRSAPVTGRISLDLTGPPGTGAREHTGAGSARCGTRVPGGAAGSPVHVAEGTGVGVRLGVGVVTRRAVGVGVGVVFMHVQVGVGAGVGVAAFMHMQVGAGAGLLAHAVQLGIGIASFAHAHAWLPGQPQPGAARPAIDTTGLPGIAPTAAAVPEPPALAASAMPPPHRPSRAAASATTTEPAINRTKSPVFPSPQTLRIPNEANRLRCVTLTPAWPLRRNYRRVGDLVSPDRQVPSGSIAQSAGSLRGSNTHLPGSRSGRWGYGIRIFPLLLGHSVWSAVGRERPAP